MRVVFTILLGFLVFNGLSQIKDIIVENYYYSDAIDESDHNGILKAGSKTYRIYVELDQGYELLSIFGAEHHPLVFSSDYPFFNHIEESVTFAKDLNKSRYKNGTVPLDTWLTIGQCSKPSSSGALYGILKSDDYDGSIVGGSNNDGGTQNVVGGLLNNSVNEYLPSLLEKDGLVSISEQLITDWFDFGFINLDNGLDTTILNDQGKTLFYNQNCKLSCSGVKGVLSGRNVVLLGQFTTAGQLKFELNLEIGYTENGEYKTKLYYARQENIPQFGIYEPLLKFPKICGCKDTNFLEAEVNFACEDNSKCITPIVFGCMDSLACNFNPLANYNIQNLCCYPGYCNDRDLEIVCPNLPFRSKEELNVSIYPIPVGDFLIINNEFPIENCQVIMYNNFGIEFCNERVSLPYELKTNQLLSGIYFVKLVYNGKFFFQKVIKI